VLLFFLLYAVLEDLYLFTFRKLPPGPLSLPVIGGVHLLGREPYRSVQNMARKYGDIFSLRMGMQERVIFIEDPDLMKQVSLYDKLIIPSSCLIWPTIIMKL
jgi:hypothetical protein